jgi:pentatricopeptide repeat protein
LELLQKFRVAPERWVEIVPNELPERRLLFRALAQAGYPQDALTILRKMIEQNPEPDLFREASSWALRWGDPDLALESAKQWQQAASTESLTEFSRATLQLARTYLSRGEKEVAYQEFREAFKEIEARSAASSPAGLDLLCGMAYEYLRLNQTVMAESLFVEATDHAPYHAPASLGLARTYRRSGKRDAAIREYQKVLLLDPENTTAENELAPLIIQRELEGAEP